MFAFFFILCAHLYFCICICLCSLELGGMRRIMFIPPPNGPWWSHSLELAAKAPSATLLPLKHYTFYSARFSLRFSRLICCQSRKIWSMLSDQMISAWKCSLSFLCPLKRWHQDGNNLCNPCVLRCGATVGAWENQALFLRRATLPSSAMINSWTRGLLRRRTNGGCEAEKMMGHRSPGEDGEGR